MTFLQRVLAGSQARDDAAQHIAGSSFCQGRIRAGQHPDLSMFADTGDGAFQNQYGIGIRPCKFLGCLDGIGCDIRRRK